MIRSASAPAGQPLTVSASFPAQSLRVDNPTNQWYLVTGLSGAWIAPYTVGVVLALQGASSVQLTATAPPNINQVLPNVGEILTITLDSDAQLPQSGTGLPGHDVPSVLGTFSLTANTHLSSLATPTLTRMIALKADRGNTDAWYVAGNGLSLTRDAWRLDPGEVVSFAQISLANIWVFQGSAGAVSLSVMIVI